MAHGWPYELAVKSTPQANSEIRYGYKCGIFPVIDIFSYLVDSDSDMHTVLILFFTLALIYCLRKLLAYRSAIQSIQYVKNKRSHVHRKS